jgi:large subunit ribosomal protein L29
MKAAKLREQTVDELRQVHTDTARDIREFKGKRGLGDSSEQPLRIRALRRDLARVKTIMRERGIAENA